jgi:prephenate dehydratase
VRIAYQGEPGAFSHEACLRFAPEAEPVPLPSFEAVVEAAKAGADAMLPVENTIAGPVEAVVALLAGAGLEELGRHVLPIRMMLIGLPGGQTTELRTVSSHPVALKQCRRLIAELALREEPAFDTAGAVRLLARSGDRSRCVLASRAAAERWGLPVLRPDVQDHSGNSTTFLRLRA